jgi:hypothetical protein
MSISGMSCLSQAGLEEDRFLGEKIKALQLSFDNTRAPVRIPEALKKRTAVSKLREFSL